MWITRELLSEYKSLRSCRLVVKHVDKFVREKLQLSGMLPSMISSWSSFEAIEDESSDLAASTITLDNVSFESLSGNADGSIANDSNEIQHLRIRNTATMSPDDITMLVNRYGWLRELSLSYSLLSDDLLFALSSDKHVCMETVRIEAHPDTKPLPRISRDAWFALLSHSPNLNVVVTSFLSNEADYDVLIDSHVPITHLYFGEDAPAPVVRKIVKNCPRLIELVIGSYGPGAIDGDLIFAAIGCPRLAIVGLGDCQITCSGLVEFVTKCHERLRVLYVWETSLIEDSDLSVTEASSTISQLLGRTWTAEYVPPW